MNLVGVVTTRAPDFFCLLVAKSGFEELNTSDDIRPTKLQRY